AGDGRQPLGVPQVQLGCRPLVSPPVTVEQFGRCFARHFTYLTEFGSFGHEFMSTFSRQIGWDAWRGAYPRWACRCRNPIWKDESWPMLFANPALAASTPIASWSAPLSVSTKGNKCSTFTPTTASIAPSVSR